MNYYERKLRSAFRKDTGTSHSNSTLPNPTPPTSNDVGAPTTVIKAAAIADDNTHTTVTLQNRVHFGTDTTAAIVKSMEVHDDNTQQSHVIEAKNSNNATNSSTTSTSFTNSTTTNATTTNATTSTATTSTTTTNSILSNYNGSNISPIGRYTNWSAEHAGLVSQPWCCIGDLIAFCDRYEFKSLSANDGGLQHAIVVEVQALLNGTRAPFDMRQRFPANIRNPENLWMCISRCPSVEYHLKRVLTALRRPLSSLSADKRRAAMQNFHLAVNELRLDISGRISEVRLYDRHIFERHFKLNWLDGN